jgi:hypothetical protein
MSSTFTFPSNAELTAIAQDKMPRLTQDRAIFKILPIRNVPEALLLWEQLDNFKGLQQVRGYNGQPPRVLPAGIKQYSMQPGVYGEHIPISEQELTTRRAQGTWGTPISIDSLVMEKQDQLLQRRLDRIEYIGWTLLSTGTFSVPGPNGAIVHTDTFNLQIYNAVVPWSTFATSTPLADFSAVQLLARGHSVDFGAAALAYMNRGTFNNLRQNTNAADLYGRRTAGLGTFNNLQGINQLLQGDDLPGIQVYDVGYYDDAAVFHTFIPNNTCVVVGVRPAGQLVGEYRMTRNLNAPDNSEGPYMRVIDRGEIEVPRQIEVHDGHNGGPVIYFASAVVVMNV